MTPAKHAGLWLIQFLSFLVIFSAFYLLLPEVYLFKRFSDRFGFITEQAWNDLFMLSVLTASVIINTLLIFTVARMKERHL
ncbi:hypothetical protein MXF13_09715 [Leclercia adecarboxylata]|uniref:hypothetical protein n=1 Tax=Leclercia TaxID=83654 RepID=UPI000CD19BE0|nr:MULTISPECIES: hypothetical protein [Leclercia]POV36161.1 hypothetical protein C3388_02445 [Leclercia sp. LSNIH5]POW68894.1 hypothetical protein C3389_04000 [Leclercia sp. LSNIH2]AUU85868.1 hypothetical protein C2U54_18430 [Leclercia sp. LSNIH1]MCZ7840793.1 hypothetical protein [Leclercia adecarboxylata]MEB5750153.1 hypothetical protein [Leclercia adecarboxylata]